jgi:hypothetical protein
MEFTFTSFMSGLIFGAVGIYYFRLGKKNQNFTLITIGIALCMINLFISNTPILLLTGAALWGYAYYLNS